ncbi:MAG: hypothetical protein HZB38_11200 [Planctomycetes bacterium]|nr:hypothetical protein [Planctomycetota bacterium]
MQIKANLAYDKPWEYSDDFKIGKLYIPPPIWPNPWKITRIIDGNQAIIHRFRAANKGNGGASDTEMYWIVGMDTTDGAVGRSLTERQMAVWVMASGKRKVQPDDLKQVDSLRVIQLNTDCIRELREAGK